ncbi:MAG: hypothetical protein ACJAT7_001463 [Psychromonas sp.]|jgi:hypothetical protein|uniref:DUF3541 domain-containing protein n=1 Tax=Psychromonas sp. TaxID=1884585 RepID=UPI0039E5DE00
MQLLLMRGLLIISLLLTPAYAQQTLTIKQITLASHLQQDAQQIKTTFEQQLFTLPPFKAGHYGLRMYRQTLDNKYSMAIWSDMARIASSLNYFSSEVHQPLQIQRYADKRIQSYAASSKTRTRLRYQATKSRPEYLYLGVDLLGSMARANEYGLKHKNDAKLREVLRRYDFKKYVSDEKMIKAWAAQLANQVYWLRQLGEQDVVEPFITAFRKTYPDSEDEKLSEQQFMNKIYGLTHIIIAASHYYQRPVKESDFQWIYDYYRSNIDLILRRCKADVVAEVGINFLLAGLIKDPLVLKSQRVIEQAFDHQHGMIPSVNGDFDLSSSEHRNVLAIMLMDWQEPHQAPTITQQAAIFNRVPYGLIAK